ncbi:hypothetical protein B0H10DRAFT_1982894 [Mycena sp. CBHHK59/15]|nr:hypothetical protein B0H10DRAFT_1982894 [Mycena sp. CBHHK59/15]
MIAVMNIWETYEHKLQNEQISPPLAAILSLTELCASSTAGTMFELVKALNEGADSLKRHSSNPISLNAGCELFIAFVTLFPHDSAALTYRTKIAELALDFIKDDSVVSTRTLKTAEALTAAGIPCTVILDSAVAYAMEKVDFVLVGSEAVVESGGLINAIGSLNIAIIPRQRINRKPLPRSPGCPQRRLLSSYKFHRLFPLSQYDLPSHNPRILSFPSPIEQGLTSENTTSSAAKGRKESSRPISQVEIAKNNPDVDYTRPDLISLVFSELGSLTPSGVSQYLVGMFAG